MRHSKLVCYSLGTNASQDVFEQGWMTFILFKLLDLFHFLSKCIYLKMYISCVLGWGEMPVQIGIENFTQCFIFRFWTLYLSNFAVLCDACTRTFRGALHRSQSVRNYWLYGMYRADMAVHEEVIKMFVSKIKLVLVAP